MKTRLKLQLDGSISRLDCHPCDVKVALEKRGLSLRRLAKQYGCSHIQRVLVSYWWAAEQVVAKALGIPVEQIWPSRYVTPRDRAQRMTRNPAARKLQKRGAQGAEA